MVIIIGAGPIGLACGLALQKRDIPFLILEKGSLVNSLFHYPTNMTFFSTADKIELGDIPFISQNTKPTRKEALEYYRRISSKFSLPIKLYEEVTQVSGENGHFRVITNKGTYSGSQVIFATGFFTNPNLMHIPGEDLPKVRHYYDEPHPYAYQKVVVIGAGNSAVDVALETWRAGAQVTMLIRGQQIKESVKYWVKPDIENRIKEGSIKAFFGAKPLAFNNDSVLFEHNGQSIRIENDFVLAMTGYQPDLRLLKNLGLLFHEDAAETPMYDDQNHESSIKGVYLAGVICGGKNTSKWFIENSIQHAEKIADHIYTSKNKKG